MKDMDTQVLTRLVREDRDMQSKKLKEKMSFDVGCLMATGRFNVNSVEN